MAIFLVVLLSLISFCLLFWQISNLISIIFGSPAVMLDRPTIIKALELIKIKKDEVFYDLGCGDGRVLIEAAKMGAKAEGFEISPYYYLLAKIRTLKYKNIKVKFQNIYNIDLSKADIVYCYLLPKILNKIKFHKNNRIISIGFPIKSLKQIRAKIIQNHLIFIYR